MRSCYLLTFCISALIGVQDNQAKELAKFQGTWMPYYVEIDGKEIKDDIKQDRLTIKGEKFTFTGAKSKMEGSLKIDPTMKPPTIDEEASLGDKITIKTVGIYEINDKRLMVCYCISPAPRPTDFSTAEKSGRYLIIYKRAD